MPQVPQRRDNEVAVMFSGGVDSTMVAILLAKQCEKVHLLTYKNGYGHFSHKNTRKRVKELEKRFPGKFVYNEISTENFFTENTINRLDEDYQKYQSGFIWCMGCKIGMHSHSIIYCVENGIPRMSDGSNGDTQEMVEQMEVSVSMFNMLYEDYGIQFVCPVYEMSRQESIDTLKGLGFNMGLQVGDRFIGVQPKCVPGELYYLPYVLFNKPPKHYEDKVVDFMDKRLSSTREYIDAVLRAKDIAKPAPIAPPEEPFLHLAE